MHDLVNAFYKGRGTLKKGQGKYFDNANKPKKACAIGAIYYGLTKKAEDNPAFVIPTIMKDYPEFRAWVDVPCGHDEEGGTIASITIHLNDEHTGHDWPDTRIAEWLEKSLVGANV